MAVTRTQAWIWPVAVAAAIRTPIAFFADDQWGDAPIRLDILERWVARPGLWWSYKETFAYGPFPTHLAGMFGLVIGAHAAARVLVVACGVIACGLISTLASRTGEPRAGLAAGLALALCPLHIQASTTFASESFYVAFVLATLLAALDRRMALCALFAFAASTTRYDGWLWLAPLALWWLAQREFRWSRRVLVAALLMLGPISLLVANGIELGHPLAAISAIDQYHRQYFAQSERTYGVALWRLAMLAYWPFAIFVVLTPGFAIATCVGAWQAIKSRSEALLPVVLGGVVPVVYTIRAVVLGSLWPMMRLVLPPASMLAIAIPPMRTRTLALCVALAAVSDVAFAIVGDGSPGIGARVAVVSPVSRLPADLRAGANALREIKGPETLDYVSTYEDIFVASGAGMNRNELLHPAPGVVPERIVAIAGGILNDELQERSRAFGHRYRRAGGEGRVSWWDLDEPKR